MTLDFSCAGTFDYPKEQFEVTGGAALFRSLHFVENNYYGMPDNDSEYFALQHDSHPELGEGHAAFIAKNYANVAALSNGKYAAPLVPDKGHYAMLDAFVDAILNDKPSPCDELAGFQSTYLAQLAIRAIECRQTLPVPVERYIPAIFIR